MTINNVPTNYQQESVFVALTLRGVYEEARRRTKTCENIKKGFDAIKGIATAETTDRAATQAVYDIFKEIANREKSLKDFYWHVAQQTAKTTGLYKKIENIWIRFKCFLAFRKLDQSITKIIYQLGRKEIRAFVMGGEYARDPLSISNTIKDRIASLMLDILARKSTQPDIQWFTSSYFNRVFSLPEAPGIIFKMAIDIRKEDGAAIDDPERNHIRFHNSLKGRLVCAARRLNLLYVPRAKQFQMNYQGTSYTLIAEEKLQLEPEQECPQKHFKTISEENANQLIEQLATFIGETGLKDIAPRNLPILAEKEKKNRRIGIVDLEEMDKDPTLMQKTLLGIGPGIEKVALTHFASSQNQIDSIQRASLRYGCASK